MFICDPRFHAVLLQQSSGIEKKIYISGRGGSSHGVVADVLDYDIEFQ